MRSTGVLAIGLASASANSIIAGLRPGDAASRSLWPKRRIEAGVAQLVEHNVANVVVVGSNPITRSSPFPFPSLDRTQLHGSQRSPGIRRRSAIRRRWRPEDEQADDEDADEELTKLSLDVDVEHRGACERHVMVSVSREDIERYFDKEYTELVKTADVPGFRHGHAPRKLIETRFRKDVGDRSRDCWSRTPLSQAIEDEKLSAISEPDIDIEAVTLPDDGPLTVRVQRRGSTGVRRCRSGRVCRSSGRFASSTTRTSTGADAEPVGPVRTPGAPRRSRRDGRLPDGQSDVQGRRRGSFEGRGGSHPHPARAQFPRRQDRRLRRTDGGRHRRRDPPGQGRA